jgi:hypothetical protein
MQTGGTKTASIVWACGILVVRLTPLNNIDPICVCLSSVGVGHGTGVGVGSTMSIGSLTPYSAIEGSLHEVSNKAPKQICGRNILNCLNGIFVSICDFLFIENRATRSCL